MNKDIDFETYLIISYGKFEIFLLDIKNYKNIYQAEFKFRDISEKPDFSLLNEFLENNIFIHEKIYLIIFVNLETIVTNKLIMH